MGNHLTVTLLLAPTLEPNTIPSGQSASDLSKPPTPSFLLPWWQWTLIGSAGLSLGAAVGLTLQANRQSDLVRSVYPKLYMAKTSLSTKQDVCSLPGYDEKCNRLNTMGFRWDVLRAAAIGGYAAAGLFTIASIVPAFVSSEPKVKNKGKSLAPRTYPVISPEGVGIIRETPF